MLEFEIYTAFKPIICKELCNNVSLSELVKLITGYCTMAQQVNHIPCSVHELYNSVCGCLISTVHMPTLECWTVH